jgi:hypothetical protein
MMISLTHVTMFHALKPHSNLLMTKALVGAIELSIKETLFPTFCENLVVCLMDTRVPT